MPWNLEAGGQGKSLYSRMPAGVGRLLGRPSFDWSLQSEPQAGLNGRTISYPRGKSLGGSSLINGMLYSRANSNDFDEADLLFKDGNNIEDTESAAVEEQEPHAEKQEEWKKKNVNASENK